MYVLDTDACVDLLRQPSQALPSIAPLQDQGPMVTTAVTVQELHEGAHRAATASKELGRVADLLSALDVLPHDRVTAERAGELAARLLGQGTPIGDLDTAIAAITLHQGATLVTRNVEHFRRVEDLAIHPIG